MFEIKVLDNPSFDNLGPEITRGADISDSLGFADPLTGRGFVRYVAHPELQKYLINHEVEELLSENSLHEDEFGIRHKKGPKFFKQIFMPFIAPLLSLAVPGVGPALSAGLGIAGQKGLFGPSYGEVKQGNAMRDYMSGGMGDFPQTAYAQQPQGGTQNTFSPQTAYAQQPSPPISSSNWQPPAPIEPPQLRQPSISFSPSAFQPETPKAFAPFSSVGQQGSQAGFTNPATQGGGGQGSSLSFGGTSPFASGLNRLSPSGFGASFGVGSNLFNQFYSKGAPAFRF